MGELTRAGRNIAWIERHCRVPEGKHVGKAVALREWQRAELRRIYDNPHRTRRAILSFGRKNGKTALCAFILLLHLCGPEARPNSQLFSAAQSRDQASVLFALAAKMVRMSPELSQFVIVRDTAKQLACPELGTLYRALSADASTAYGLSPVLVIHDELGQVKGPQSELYEALETATGAQSDPLSIIISTQAPTDADLLSTLIDDALTGADPRTVVSLYTAPDDLDPFGEEAIRAANPAFGDFQDAEETMNMASAAKRMPSKEAAFRNLILNQRVEATSPFITRAVWESCAAPVAEFDGPVFMGLDLSKRSDLTACVAVSPISKTWHALPQFWIPSAGLAERARSDRVPYDVWVKQGFIDATPGATVDYDFVAVWLYEACQRWDVRRIAFDRWNFSNLMPCLLRAGFAPEQIEGDGALFAMFGQGFKDMSPALASLEAEVLNGRLAHGGHPVLAMCAANAAVEMDAAGNRKLAKHKSHGRIDGMVALAMAMGVATSMVESATAGSYLESDDMLVF